MKTKEQTNFSRKRANPKPMNKTYALELLDMVERGVLNKTDSLAKEAFNYLLKLKKIERYTQDKILKLKYD